MPFRQSDCGTLCNIGYLWDCEIIAVIFTILTSAISGIQICACTRIPCVLRSKGIVVVFYLVYVFLNMRTLPLQCPSLSPLFCQFNRCLFFSVLFVGSWLGFQPWEWPWEWPPSRFLFINMAKFLVLLIVHQKQFVNIKKNEALDPSGSQLPELIPGFSSMKRLGVFPLPPDGMLVHRRSFSHNLLGFPNNLLVPVYTPGWREAL